MNLNCKHSAALLACLFAAAVAQAQDKSTLTTEGVGTNSTAGITLDFKAQPTLAWGDHVQISGLLVDMVRPQETWNLFNPRAPAPTSALVLPEQMNPTPVRAFDRDGDVDTHGPNFALLRFTFP